MRVNSPPPTSMVLFLVTADDVVETIRELPAIRSTEIDCMSMWMVKQFCNNFLYTLVSIIINASFESGVFPHALKRAKVIQSFKNEGFEKRHPTLSVLFGLY